MLVHGYLFVRLFVYLFVCFFCSGNYISYCVNQNSSNSCFAVYVFVFTGQYLLIKSLKCLVLLLVDQPKIVKLKYIFLYNVLIYLLIY